MTSGVYTLTFPSGSNYIGKSINIENRWLQHGDKFRKGTAAKLMQAEFDRYGPPEGSITFKCHADHIDIMETCLINRMGPNLNGTSPEDPFSELQGDNFYKIVELLHMSTAQHIAKIYEFDDGQTLNCSKIEGLKESLAEAEELVEALYRKRTQETIDKDISNTIRIQKDTISELNATISVLDTERHTLASQLAYKRMPWWKKLFN